MVSTEHEVAAEIKQLHDFFTQWFAGTIAGELALFEHQLERRLAPGFINIQPGGRLLRREDLVAQIAGSHGANPAFGISIAAVELHHELENGILFASYEEYQSGAKNSPAENARLSTVLMRRSDAGFEWLSVHETWLPNQKD